MEVIITVFLAFACVIALFAVLMMVYEMINEIRNKRKQLQNAANEDPKSEAAAAVEEKACIQEPEAAVAGSPAEEVTEEKPAEESVANETADENAVSFSVSNVETLEEKYLALSPEYKKYYDEIVQYAFDQEGVKRIKNERYEEYKIRSTKLVRLTIRQGTVLAQFVLLNADFKNYIRENNVSVKPAPVVMKITSEESVQAAKNSIDIAIKAHKEQREYIRAQRNARRRKAKSEQSEQSE